MRTNQLRRKLSEGQTVFGAACTMLDPAVVEIIGLAGYDFCFIDMEHVSTDLVVLENMCRAADAVGVTPLVRVDDPGTILRALEVGVQGVIVPHVKSGEEARRLESLVRYPPLGSRGISPTSRAAQYGFGNIDDHLRESNDEVLLIGLIEDREAIDDIDSILSALDIAFIAPFDLAGSLGHPHEPNHPDTIAAVEVVLTAARREGSATLCVPVNHRMYTKSAAELIELGVSALVIAQDSSVLAQGFSNNLNAMAAHRSVTTATEA